MAREGCQRGSRCVRCEKTNIQNPRSVTKTDPLVRYDLRATVTPKNPHDLSVFAILRLRSLVADPVFSLPNRVLH